MFIDIYRKKIIYISAILASMLGVILFLTYSDTKKENLLDEPTPFLFEEQTTETPARVLGDTHKTFSHPVYNFSLEYPKDFDVQGYKEPSGGETIVFQNPKDKDIASVEDKQGFQIFIIPFEGDALTQERILDDAPETIIQNLQEIVIGREHNQNHKALLFWSESHAIGQTREVWFVHNGYLYEITTFAHFDTELAKIMSTWTFTK